MSDKPIWVRWFPADFRGSGRVAQMSRDEEYLYRVLLDYQATEGALPSDPSRLARLAKMSPDEFASAWASLRDCFEQGADGGWRNGRMHDERERTLRVSESLREKGRAGGLAKAARLAGAKREQYPGSSSGTPQAEPSSSLRSSSRELRVESREVTKNTPRNAKPPPTEVPPSDAGASGPPKQEPEASTPKRTRKQPTGDHAALMAWWATAWEEARGIAWSFSGKDGAAAQRLLKLAHGDLAAIKARGDRMLCSTNRWHAERASLAHLAAQWNELGVEILPAQVNGSGGNGYHRETAAEAAYRKSQEALDRVFGVESRTVLSRTAP